MYTLYGDGVHDDTKALQECIDKVKDGGTIYFPDGTYLISSSLIFYSNQTFKLSDNAVILRSKDSSPVTKYLLASYSEPQWGGYEGTHDVVISGGIFDGNADLTEKSTLVNTVHCRNILITGCRFRNCSTWHMIEINSTENAVIDSCIFDGHSYTFIPDHLLNEQIQLDLARDGSYGPVYNCDGTLIDFCKDDTVCRNITITNNILEKTQDKLEKTKQEILLAKDKVTSKYEMVRLNAKLQDLINNRNDLQSKVEYQKQRLAELSSNSRVKYYIDLVNSMDELNAKYHFIKSQMDVIDVQIKEKKEELNKIQEKLREE